MTVALYRECSSGLSLSPVRGVAWLEEGERQDTAFQKMWIGNHRVQSDLIENLDLQGSEEDVYGGGNK